MRNYKLVPSNLDVDLLIHKFPPGIPSFTKQKLVEIISLIYTQRAFTSWKVYDNFVQIKHDSFFSIADDYLLYVKYLIETGVILRDEIFRPQKEYPDDPKSIGYKFQVPYNQAFPMRYDIDKLPTSDKRITRSRKKTKTENEAKAKKNPQYAELLKEYPFIRNLDKLDFDFESAYKYLDESAREIQEMGYPNEQLEQIIIKYSTYVGVIEQLKKLPSKDCSIDEFGNRLHSPFTRLKRKLRYFITYKGEHLYSLDLKNSQPFLLVALFNPSFWLPRMTATVDGTTKRGKEALQHQLLKRVVRDINSVKGRLPQYLNIEDLYPEFAHSVWGMNVSEIIISTTSEEDRESKDYSISGVSQKKRARVLTILDGIRRQSNDNQDYDEFRKDASQGFIYEKLEQKLDELLKRNPVNHTILNSENFFWNDDKKARRDIVKGLVVRAMFASKKSKKQITRFARELLQEVYPSVYGLFQYTKINDYKDLARILQRIESFLILKACAKAISKANKQIPFWTIHDSIVTIRKYKDDVNEIMSDTIKKYVGLSPTIKVESWKDYKPGKLSILDSDPEDLISDENYL